MHQTTIFIIQLYFINELLRLKVLVVKLRFYLRKRCQKTSCRAEVYAYATAEVQVYIRSYRRRHISRRLSTIIKS